MINWDDLVLGPVMGIFGEVVTYYPAGGLPPFSLADAVFDREYQEIVLQGDGSENTSSRPVLGVRLSEFPQPPRQGDRAAVMSANATYFVREVKPDGHGYAKLMLNLGT